MRIIANAINYFLYLFKSYKKVTKKFFVYKNIVLLLHY
jgi:hypothetical protein